jgi:hypothetical protein
MTSWTSIVTSSGEIEFKNTSPSTEQPGDISTKNATGSHQGQKERGTLAVPVVGAWDAVDHYVIVVPPEKPLRD